MVTLLSSTTVGEIGKRCNHVSWQQKESRGAKFNLIRRKTTIQTVPYRTSPCSDQISFETKRNEHID